MSLTLSSPAFPHRGEIPEVHTCDGANTPPPLKWSGAPAGTRSLVLIVDDPDAPDPKAPTHTYVHWVVYDIAPSVAGLAPGERRPAGAHEGLNGWKKRAYAASLVRLAPAKSTGRSSSLQYMPSNEPTTGNCAAYSGAGTRRLEVQ